MTERNGKVRRRRHQDGSLFKDATGTRWMGRWWQDVVDPESGEVKRKRMYEAICWVREYPSERAARRELDKRIGEANADDFRPAMPITFGEFASKWEREILIHHKLSTRHSYRTIVNQHLLPTFGKTILRDIQAENIQAFISGMKRAPLTVRHVLVLLMGMWNYAVAWGYAQHNPFPRGTSGKLLLKLPPQVKPKTYKFTIEETLAIIDAAPKRWKLMLRTLAECGMRPGELAGMRRDGLNGRIIRITQSSYRRKLQPPKTPNAVREFRISQVLADDLRAWIEESKDKPNKYGLMWPNRLGNPLDMDRLSRKVLNPILRKLGISQKLEELGVKGGWYPLRHMNVSEMRRRGVPLATIQQRVGHAVGSDVTDRHYVHGDDEDDVRAADLMGELLSGKKTGAAEDSAPAGS